MKPIWNDKHQLFCMKHQTFESSCHCPYDERLNDYEPFNQKTLQGFGVMSLVSKRQNRSQKCQLSELEKELLTLHYYIHKIIEKDRLWNNVTDRQVQIVFKACKKFLSHAKDSKFETTKDGYGDKFTHVLEVNLGDEGKQERRYPKREATYLSWVSFGTHHIIREFLPNWIWLTDETRTELKKFYKPTLESLLR